MNIAPIVPGYQAQISRADYHAAHAAIQSDVCQFSSQEVAFDRATSTCRVSDFRWRVVFPAHDADAKCSPPVAARPRAFRCQARATRKADKSGNSDAEDAQEGGAA